mmetsp:Transcript_52611/g.127469  ORF Transcript_52611/g.127469 Transcript_52611/m.127469 type:complete len:241 (-) Transcript_52611:1188-1910(-)
MDNPGHIDCTFSRCFQPPSSFFYFASVVLVELMYYGQQLCAIAARLGCFILLLIFFGSNQKWLVSTTFLGSIKHIRSNGSTVLIHGLWLIHSLNMRSSFSSSVNFRLGCLILLLGFLGSSQKRFISNHLLGGIKQIRSNRSTVLIHGIWLIHPLKMRCSLRTLILLFSLLGSSQKRLVSNHLLGGIKQIRTNGSTIFFTLLRLIQALKMRCRLGCLILLLGFLGSSQKRFISNHLLGGIK